MKTSQRGFIALISTLIISVILFASAVTLAHIHITHRYILLDFEQKLQSERLAEACVEMVRVFIYNNPDISKNALPYDGTFPIGDSECSVHSITQNGTVREVITQGMFKESVTTLRADIDTENNTTIAWQEIPNP